MSNRVFKAITTITELTTTQLWFDLVLRLNTDPLNPHTGFMCTLYMITELYFFAESFDLLQDFIQHADYQSASMVSKETIYKFLDTYFRELGAHRKFFEYVKGQNIHMYRAAAYKDGFPLVLLPGVPRNDQLKCVETKPTRYLAEYIEIHVSAKKGSIWALTSNMFVDISSGISRTYSNQVLIGDIYEFVSSGTKGVDDKDIYGIVHFDSVKNMLIDLYKRGKCSTPTELAIATKVEFVSKRKQGYRTFDSLQVCLQTYIEKLRSYDINVLYNAIECFD